MPVALAPGMGLNAYFAYQVIHLSDLDSTIWQISLCPCQSRKGIAGLLLWATATAAGDKYDFSAPLCKLLVSSLHVFVK